MTIKEKILTAKKDTPALLELLESFAPLLRKYAKKLSSEDAYSELQLKFIEIILAFHPEAMRSQDDPSLISYLTCSIYHYYIYLSKRERLNSMSLPISAFAMDSGESDADLLDRLCTPTAPDYSIENFDFLRKHLTPYETDILILIYYYNYKVIEVAVHYGVSNSAISQAKSNAIRKLRNIMFEAGTKNGY